MMSDVKPTALAVAMVLGMGALPAQANSINLASSGVAADGSTLLAGGAIDPHFTITLPDNATVPAFVVNQGAGSPIMPAGPFWAPEGPTAADPTSQWVAPNAAGEGPPGVSIYHTTVDLTGLDPSTAQISGLWGVDNTGQIFLNGQHVVGQDIVDSQTSAGAPLFPFLLKSGFHTGINTLDFYVWNDGGPGSSDDPSGFRVAMTGTANALGSAQPPPTTTPEPSTLAFVGLVGLGLFVRKARRRAVA